MNGFRFRLLPRDDRFYHQLSALAEAGHQSALALAGWIQQDLTHSDAADRWLAAQRQAADTLDTLTHDLCRTFITPYDREDLHAFAHQLGGLPGKIQGVGTQLGLMNGSGHRVESLKTLAGLVLPQSEALSSLIETLPKGNHPQKLQDPVRILGRLALEAETLQARAMAEAYAALTDPRAFGLAHSVAMQLTGLTGEYRDVGHSALQMVLKHS